MLVLHDLVVLEGFRVPLGVALVLLFTLFTEVPEEAFEFACLHPQPELPPHCILLLLLQFLREVLPYFRFHVAHGEMLEVNITLNRRSYLFHVVVGDRIFG